MFGTRGVDSLYFPLVLLSERHRKIFQTTLASPGKTQESTYTAVRTWTSAMLIRQIFYTFRQTEADIAVVLLLKSIFREVMNSEQN